MSMTMLVPVARACQQPIKKIILNNRRISIKEVVDDAICQAIFRDVFGHVINDIKCA